MNTNCILLLYYYIIRNHFDLFNVTYIQQLKKLCVIIIIIMIRGKFKHYISLDIVNHLIFVINNWSEALVFGLIRKFYK